MEIRWKRLFVIWLVAFTGLAIWLLVDNRRLASDASTRANENTHLIKQVAQQQRDIQHSRLESCIANFNSLLEAFRPFKPKADDPRTPRDEVQDFKKFTDHVKAKRANCPKQVALKESKKNATRTNKSPHKK